CTGRAIDARPQARGIGADNRSGQQISEGGKKMSVVLRCPPAPVGQQGPPTRAAAFDSWRSLRAACGPLLVWGRQAVETTPQALKAVHARRGMNPCSRRRELAVRKRYNGCPQSIRITVRNRYNPHASFL